MDYRVFQNIDMFVSFKMCGAIRTGSAKHGPTQILRGICCDRDETFVISIALPF